MSLLDNCLASLLLLKSLPLLHPDRDLYILLSSFLLFVDFPLTTQGWLLWARRLSLRTTYLQRHSKWGKTPHRVKQGRFPIPGFPSPAFSTCSTCSPANSYLLLSEIRYTWSITRHIPRVLSVLHLFSWKPASDVCKKLSRSHSYIPASCT